MNSASSPSTGHLTWTPALILALLAFLVSASRINHGLVDSLLPAGPGLTTDESINLRQGIYLFDAFTQHGPLMCLPGTSAQVYGAEEYMPDYVPLGRFLLGAAHELTSWMIPGAETAVVNLPAARLASSVAVALTVLLLVLGTGRLYGTPTAVTAGLMFLLMPRVIGHSRVASLETLTTLAWLAALLPLLTWWTRERPPTATQAAISGLLWGILMLVKIQGILLPPIITIYAFLHLGLRAFLPLSIMAVTGLAVFYGGWPWLWLDPVQHLTSYLASTSDRQPVNNWYLAHRFEDKATPWHFPFVLMAVTIPLHTVCGFLLRLLQRRLDSVESLLLASIAVPLLVFALPGTPVYDGTRLFLFVMPAFAILSARGLVLLISRREPKTAATSRPLRTSGGRPMMAVVGLLLLIDVVTTIPQLGPFSGDAYNNIVRMMPADRDTFEASYWEDALNGDFWRQVPENSTVAVAPVLHGVRLQDMMSMIPIVRQRNITLEPFYYEPENQRGLVLLLHRLADLPPGLRQPPPGNTPLVEVRQNGQILARLVDTSEITWEEKPEW